MWETINHGAVVFGVILLVGVAWVVWQDLDNLL